MHTTPAATYRLQLHGGFTFEDAAKAVPYLAALGVSHVYLSPVFKAMPGSTHGYDVLDPREVNPELGGRAGLQRLFSTLEAHDMGAILDIVPNHVGVGGATQPWWRDVLRWGRESQFAKFFDIDWEPAEGRSADVLVLPILTDELPAVLESGDLNFAVHEGEVGLQHLGTWLPLAPETYDEVFGTPAILAEASGLTSARLPAPVRELCAPDPERRRRGLDMFRDRVRSDASAATAVQNLLDQANNDPHRSKLKAVLPGQHYELMSWREVGERFNYRRFFAIDDLAAVRVEDERVFETAHELVLQLAAEPAVAGLRIDHVDGLYDPVGYLTRLRARMDSVGAAAKTIHVEKILAMDEDLPADWPVDGATGYEFLGHIDGLFVDTGAEEALTAAYTGFTGQGLTFDQVETRSREEFVESEFAAERARLLRQLKHTFDDVPPEDPVDDEPLRDALTVVLASMRRYRTYLVRGETSAEDNDVLDAALDGARQLRPGLADAIGRIDAALHPERPAATTSMATHRMRFRRLFDQVASAVAAKGVEDTAFYRYSRLLTLNEVGASPHAFGVAPGNLHQWFADRARQWPLAMSASSTHDTKRDEDVRARIAVLSEMPERWAAEATAWAEMNAGYHRLVDGLLSPSPEREYYVYQTLVGSWEGRADRVYRERVVEHLVKAMREAKQRTTWIDPDDRYERAAREFVELILADNDFTSRLDAFVRHVRAAGRINALSALVLKAMAPGIPDFYQGTEMPSFSLTDPDNRRPVDFPGLSASLAKVGTEQPVVGDEHFKQWLTQRLLHARRYLGEVMLSPAYTPLAVSGNRSENVFAFARGNAGAQVAVVVPRLVTSLLDGEGHLQGGAWTGTTVQLPDSRGTWRNLLLDEEVEAGTVDAARLFHRLPFAVLADAKGATS